MRTSRNATAGARNGRSHAGNVVEEGTGAPVVVQRGCPPDSLAQNRAARGVDLVQPGTDRVERQAKRRKQDRRRPGFRNRHGATGAETHRSSRLTPCCCPVAIKFQGAPAPGEAIVPPKEPVVKPVTWLNTRSTVKLPVASANRPVPPFIVPVSAMERTPGAGVPSVRNGTAARSVTHSRTASRNNA